MAAKKKTAKGAKGTKSGRKLSLSGKQKRARDITNLLESIRVDWTELSQTLDDIHNTKAMKKHLKWCEAELKELLEKAKI